ncbi:uncharacterized protein ATC70_012405 [Mucor velutinosus]|uniref:Uncharacterized protein n=1 Tax=Mucor velutinosus TaxID=708070 RepID=A0AAN7HXG8_9FUNG|nr:hypothetical protein ATC70_012405 [Mucor velutinosus]
MYADAKRPVKSVSTSGTTLDQAAVSASGSGSFTTTVSIPTAPSGTSDAVTASNASFDLDSADMPIDKLLPLSELIDEENDQEEEEGTRDLPRRRIMVLKATLRNLLVRQVGKSITHTQLKKERPDITEEENRVCMLLGKLLLPYLPTRDHYSYIGFQLPFLLLANDIFCSVGYHKFAVDLCPTSSCGSLHAMRVDAASLYALCTRENVGIAIQYKDAVFNSFFDIRAITQACKSFGLTFVHNLTILPGLTSVRILGTKPSSNKSVSNAKKPLDIDWDTVRELQTRTNQTLKKDTGQLEIDNKTVFDELKAANKDHKKEQYSTRIKDSKKQWHTDRSKHQEIKEPKAQRYQLFIAIKQTKQQLSNMRTRAFLTRKAIEYRNKDIPLVSNYEPPPSDQHLDSMVFSGTDNGLAVMTEAIGMNLNKYKYHLSLHNKFSPLTCMYCFGPTSHPTQTTKAKDGKTKTRSIHDAFLCLNPACASVLNHRAIQGRDKTSALAIAVSGLSILLFKQPLPVFNPKPSQSNTGIISKTTSFCNRNEKRDGSGAALADA